MEKGNFKLCLKTQYWNGQEEYEYWSNGEILLSVNDIVITQKDIDEEWGISESALFLLRTLEKEYQCKPKENEGLIVHGCGALLMLGCPISIHWSVKHQEDKVYLSDFMKKTDTVSSFKRYAELKSVIVNFEEYKKQIILFAQKVKTFFENSKAKIFDNEYDRKLNEEYWNEFSYYCNKYNLN